MWHPHSRAPITPRPVPFAALHPFSCRPAPPVLRHIFPQKHKTFSPHKLSPARGRGCTIPTFPARSQHWLEPIAHLCGLRASGPCPEEQLFRRNQRPNCKIPSPELPGWKQHQSHPRARGLPCRAQAGSPCRNAPSCCQLQGPSRVGPAPAAPGPAFPQQEEFTLRQKTA